MNEILFAWLLAFVTSHATPQARTATTVEDVTAVREAAVRSALVVAFDESESPLGGDVRHTDDYRARAETALLLLAIEVHETGLQPRLWRGECRPRECDHGLATGEFQLHLGTWGVELRGDKWVRACTSRDPASRCITRADALADHDKAARAALHMLRGGGLEGYTGQGPEGPAVLWIRAAADGYVAAHPPPLQGGE